MEGIPVAKVAILAYLGKENLETAALLLFILLKLLRYK